MTADKPAPLPDSFFEPTSDDERYSEARALVAHLVESARPLLRERQITVRNLETLEHEINLAKSWLANRPEADVPAPRWGVYCLDGPAQDTWCQHTEDHRIETDERTARTIAILFRDRSTTFTVSRGCRYEARRLPS